MSERTSNANNKTIDRDMLLDFFAAMHKELLECQRIADEEIAKNEPLALDYQEWTMRHFDGSLRFAVYFKDGHEISYDNYDKFVSMFKSQAYAIKSIYVHCRMSYYKTSTNGSSDEYIHNSIDLNIYEDRLSVGSDIASSDTRMNEVYNMITQRIAEAPPKYDHIIKAKEFINVKIGFAMGLIPAIVIVTATAFIPQLHDFYRDTFYLFPVLILAIAAILSFFLGSAKTNSSYAKLIPQKYGGYDHNRGGSYYNDDLKTLTETSDVLIGDKVNNLLERKRIEADEKRFTKLIPIFLGIAAVVCIVMFFLTR